MCVFFLLSIYVYILQYLTFIFHCCLVWRNKDWLIDCLIDNVVFNGCYVFGCGNCHFLLYCCLFSMTPTPCVSTSVENSTNLKMLWRVTVLPSHHIHAEILTAAQAHTTAITRWVASTIRVNVSVSAPLSLMFHVLCSAFRYGVSASSAIVVSYWLCSVKRRTCSNVCKTGDDYRGEHSGKVANVSRPAIESTSSDTAFA